MLSCTKNPFFSIIVPMYNSGLNITKLIDSVVAQSFSDYELIIIDDGSKDNSYEICCNYAEKNDRIKIFHKNNSGALNSRCLGVKESKGTYIVFLDADDYLEKKALKVLYCYIQKFKCDCIIYGFNVVENGRIIDTVGDEEILYTSKINAYKKIFFDRNYNAIWRKCAKRDCFSILSYGDYEYFSVGEDLLQSLDILEHTQDILFVNDILYNYTINPNSITHNDFFNKYDPYYTIYFTVLKYLQENDYFNDSVMLNYKQYALKLVLNDLSKLSHSDHCFRYKINTLKKVMNSKYVKELLSKNVYKELTLKSKFQIKLFHIFTLF